MILARQARYEATEKGRASAARYNASEKGRASAARYNASEKGRATHVLANARYYATHREAYLDSRQVYRTTAAYEVGRIKRARRNQ